MHIVIADERQEQQRESENGCDRVNAIERRTPRELKKLVTDGNEVMKSQRASTYSFEWAARVNTLLLGEVEG